MQHLTPDEYSKIRVEPMFPDCAPILAILPPEPPKSACRLPAHAHADIFSYELSLFGLPFVVDTGVCEYAEGPMRDHDRHTRAHNTVCVDGVSQAECWKSFRVARRYPPKDVSYDVVNGSRVFRGRFGGYARLIGDRIQHERTVVVDPHGRCVRVEDAVHGEGVHTVESRIHVHPACRVKRADSAVEIERDGVRLAVSAFGGDLETESGPFCLQMGLRVETQVLILRHCAPLPIRLGYVLSY